MKTINLLSTYVSIFLLLAPSRSSLLFGVRVLGLWSVLFSDLICGLKGSLGKIHLTGQLNGGSGGGGGGLDSIFRSISSDNDVKVVGISASESDLLWLMSGGDNRN